MNHMTEHFLWVEKFRPHTINDCILPTVLKNQFEAMLRQSDIPNLLLVGSPGTGKTTVARAMIEQLDADCYLINGSLKGNIDTLRNDIANYASSVSFKKKRKYVILDEADYLTHVTQPALRNFMEEYAKNCGFILTANYKNKIIPALQSRCSVIEFDFPKSEAPWLAQAFYGRTIAILEMENIKFDTQVLAAFISKYYPDYRRIINELQRYSVNGNIDSGVLTEAHPGVTELIRMMKTKDFTKVRQWAAEQASRSQDVFRTFYDEGHDYFSPIFIPELVLLIAKYQYQASFVADYEINLSAFLAEVMVEAQYK
jgi:DNA polymerase III delta prime subunit